MKSMIALLTLALATPVTAQTVAAATDIAVPAPASPVAVEIAGKLFPDGTYRRMLGPQFSKMMSGMTDGIGAMPMGPFLKAAGLPESDAAKLDKATLGEIMEIVDPYYKERMRRTMDGMFAAMVPLFEQLEPDLRAGLAISLSNRFSIVQLNELRSFFSTPTGSAFASQQMLLFMDPAVMGKMQAAMPKIMQELPNLVAAASKSTAELPKARSYKDLSPAERDKLMTLLGIDPKKAKK